MTARIKQLGTPSYVLEELPVYRRNPGGSWYNDYNVTSCVAQQSYYYHKGYDNNHYHARLRRGEIIPYTTWNQNESSASFGQPYYHIKRNSDGAEWYHNAIPESWGIQWYRPDASTLMKDFGVNSFDPAVVQLQKAAASIYSRGWDALTFFAELHKTVRMFKDVVQKLRSAASSREALNAWLEGRYGWRILMYDIIDINKALRNVDGGRTRFKKRNGESEKLTSISYETVTFSSVEMVFKYVDTVNISYRGSVIADIKAPDVQLNLPITLWEIVPYSFVLDWVVNVGRWLEALSFLALTSNYAAAWGIKFDHTRTTTVQSITAQSGYSEAELDFAATSQCSYVVRTPSVIPTTPLVSVNIDAFKVMDLVALLMQRLR